MPDLIRFKVSGTVQGVNFRQATKKQALALGLRGWVSNSPDESVEGLAVGSQEHLEQFRSYLKQGPPHANVAKVELVQHQTGISEEQAKQALDGRDGFAVVR
ncbi:Acylphosphatase-domain-containing protein [Papiliotrema laurentii]|uniref:acylphosphatase n=1 Tax=Papiliotrema laurentii TaxID=5418 RepID=A0AAD9FR94_PAPLA|nr:Acylphosphatase-domain-containing protein [Papiliotrema laurentii]